ncbi:MAG: acetyl-CoA carboxylase biotin carboxyl carrier protein subunit [Marinilabiliales bacterium]|nr:acetyl-CoA carboxylase biotin carboxyl carrier protein subunit [Marinilabiliales bacterium]
MDENKWEYGRDDEELFELAMHDRQYRDYKSGVAGTRFIKEVDEKKAELSRGTVQKVSAEKAARRTRDRYSLHLFGNNIHMVRRRWPPCRRKEVRKGEIIMYIMIGRTFREVRADRDGVIKKILVKRGEKVSKGDPLVEFE